MLKATKPSLLLCTPVWIPGQCYLALLSTYAVLCAGSGFSHSKQLLNLSAFSPDVDLAVPFSSLFLAHVAGLEIKRPEGADGPCYLCHP